MDKRTKTPTAKVSDAIADDEFLSKVLIERRKELVGEGQRFFDAMRNNETIVRYSSEENQGWHYSLLKESPVPVCHNSRKDKPVVKLSDDKT